MMHHDQYVHKKVLLGYTLLMEGFTTHYPPNIHTIYIIDSLFT
jgi:hypothetical protein